jgi:proteasome lid subunit RPN8/RPN11
MNLLEVIMRFFWRAPTYQTAPQPPKLIITHECLDGLADGLRPSLERRHEGVAYLLGRTDGTVTLATTVFVPAARTTAGSFFVEPRSMAACMQAAAAHELQVVAQVHTHPGGAYHSDGDVEGAKIRYAGYASVVLPNYGERLPRLDGAAAYLWTAAGRWQQLSPADLIVIPGAGPWTRSNGS